MAEQSILLTTKKLLNLDPDYEAFDQEIIVHINSVLFTLNQLGVGPSTGFEIEDEGPEWTDFIGDRMDLSAVKSFVYLSVKLMFDPPATSFAIDAIKNLIAQYEWRINVQVENAILEGGVV